MNSWPVFSIECMMTASFRATATAARLNPRRSRNSSPHVLRLDYDLNPEIGHLKYHRVRRAHLTYLLDEGGGGVSAPVTVREAR